MKGGEEYKMIYWFCVSAYMVCTFTISEIKSTMNCGSLFKYLKFDSKKEAEKALYTMRNHPYYRCSRVKKEE